MKNNKPGILLRINKIWVYLALVFPFFRSDIVIDLRSLDWIAEIYEIWKALSFFTVVVLFFWYVRTIRKMEIVFITFLLVAILSCVINGSAFDITRCISLYADGVFFMFLLRIADHFGDYQHLYKALYVLLAVFCLINLFTVIRFLPRHGMYIPDNAGTIVRDRYFLGSKNYQILFVLPLVVFSSLYDMTTVGTIRKRTWAIQLLSIIPLFLAFSATSVTAMMMYYCIVLLLGRGRKKMLVVSVLATLGNLCLFLILTVLDGYRLFSGILTFLFNKNLEAQRVEVWRRYLSAIEDKVMTGYGFVSSTLRINRIGVLHAHSQYLELLYQGGIVLLSVFFILVLFSFLQLDAANGTHRIVFAGLCAILLMYQTDYYYDNNCFYLMVFLCSNWMCRKNWDYMKAYSSQNMFFPQMVNKP